MARERSKQPKSSLVRRFRRVTALVAGDLMVDEFVWGQVERISPEAPVPVVQVTSESVRLGGSANVVNNVRALGGQAVACGVVGADGAGRILGYEMARLGADTGGIMRSREAPTVRKTRIIAHQQQVVRLDREDANLGSSRAAARARGFLLTHVWRCDVVVLSDYGKGLITAPLLAALAALRERRDFLLVIDPKEVNFPYYRRPTLITPNRDEASRASGIEIRDEGTLVRAGEALLGRWEADAVLITRGAEGMTLFRPNVLPRQVPTAARRVFDVTGAGDTVVATCALALAAGADFETAAAFANHAAGIVVAEVGTATVAAERLLAELTGGGRRNPAGRRAARSGR